MHKVKHSIHLLVTVFRAIVMSTTSDTSVPSWIFPIALAAVGGGVTAVYYLLYRKRTAAAVVPVNRASVRTVQGVSRVVVSSDLIPDDYRLMHKANCFPSSSSLQQPTTKINVGLSSDLLPDVRDFPGVPNTSLNERVFLKLRGQGRVEHE